MLSLRSISLVQFKNYTHRSFAFHKRIVGICGKNGAGKTNVLDAIHYLCFTKSYFSSTDSVNVQQGSNGFRIEGTVEQGAVTENVVCILRENGKKEFEVNHEAYTKFSQHIGRYPCVVIAPDDAVLITGGSEERRKFLDALLSQLDSNYLQQLIRYTKVLQQRNSFLKSAADTNRPDEALLAALDEQLIDAGNYIFTKRRDFLIGFLPAVKRLYTTIAIKEEDLSLIYDSRLLTASFATLLAASRQKDLLLQRTTAGVHRDDISIHAGPHLFKNIASQGQRKSLLFALKLTEMEVIQKEKKTPPLLLLDDVFEKLDESRIGSLLQKVCTENDGQVFITDTSAERLDAQLQQLGTPFEIIAL